MGFHLPGWPGGDPGALTAAAGEWKSLAAGIREVGATAGGAMAGLLSGWQGPGEAAVEKFWDEYKPVFDKAATAWEDMAANLEQAAAAIEKAHSDYEHMVAVMAATAAAGLALTIFTLGGSDAAAGAAETAEAGTVVAILSTLTGAIATVGEAIGLSASVSVGLVEAFGLGFSLSSVDQAITSEWDGNGLQVNFVEALETGAISAASFGLFKVIASGAVGLKSLLTDPGNLVPIPSDVPTITPQEIAELTPADLQALSDYTGNEYYSELNSMLRGVGGTLDAQRVAQLDQLSTNLSAALSKLPDYQGFVYRGTNLPADVVSQYQPGAVVKEEAFTSASTDAPFGGNTQFTIFSTTGKEISQFSQISGENEVIFDKGTVFRVISNDNVGGVSRIVLRQVGP